MRVRQVPQRQADAQDQDQRARSCERNCVGRGDQLISLRVRACVRIFAGSCKNASQLFQASALDEASSEARTISLFVSSLLFAVTACLRAARLFVCCIVEMHARHTKYVLAREQANERRFNVCGTHCRRTREFIKLVGGVEFSTLVRAYTHTFTESLTLPVIRTSIGMAPHTCSM